MDNIIGVDYYYCYLWQIQCKWSVVFYWIRKKILIGNFYLFKGEKGYLKKRK